MSGAALRAWKAWFCKLIPSSAASRSACLVLALVAASCSTPGSQTAPGKPPRETAQQEAARLRAQRERAQFDGVLVFSAGTLLSAKVTHGTELALQFRPLSKQGKAGSTRVPLDCRHSDCQQREFLHGRLKQIARNRVSVLTLAPGKWQLSAARLSGQAPVRFKSPVTFEIRKGYATYLGAIVLGGIDRKDKTPAPPLLRFSSVQADMSYALDVFEQTRGRRLLNVVQNQVHTQVLR